MASLAYDRGDTKVAAAWKMHAVQSQQREANAEAGAKVTQMFAPKYVPPPGQILGSEPDTPYSRDEEYRRLDTQYREHQAALEGMSATAPSFNEVSGKAQVLEAKRDARRDELVEAAQNAGLWSEQNQRVLDAQDSLRSKSDAVARMFHPAGGGS